MKTEWLESFIETAKTKSLSKASEQLHMTQPALSKQMRKLEEDLGVTLFIRSATGVELTSAGEILLQEGKSILSSVHALQKKLVSTQEACDLTIGTWQSMAAFYLPYQLASAKEPNRHIDIKTSHHYYDLLEQLESNQIDGALFDDREVQHTYWSKLLFKEDFYLFVNDQHPLAEKESVLFEDFKEEPIVVLPPGCDVRTLVEKAYKRHNLKISISNEIEFAQSIMGFISANLGISILPEIFMRHLQSSNIKALPITDFKFKREISLVAKNPDVGKMLYTLFFKTRS
ncbi:LysR family transcriptional regulator [Priestia megaterium]|uniref:LysR family transcriptional regulator n=1 Tax=Priestia megaterium TaxID=1404 RepID=UPI003012C4F4